MLRATNPQFNLLAVIVSMAGDTTPPNISNRVPATSAINISVDTTIAFTVTDDETGVDTGSINVSISTVAAVVAGVAQSGYGYNIVSIGGGAHNAVITPPTLNFGSSIQINIEASDSEVVPNTVNDQYSFITGVELDIPALYYDNRLDDTGVSITANNSLPTSPVSRIIDNERFPVWQANSIGISNINIAFPAPVAVDSLILSRHNLEDVSVALLSSADNFVSDSTIVSQFTPGEYDELIEFTETTKQYWKLSIATHSEKSYIGEMFLGPKFELPRLPQDFDPSEEITYVIGTEAENGTGSRHELSSIRIADMTTRIVGSAFSADLEAFDDVTGRYKAFWFCATPDMAPSDYYGVFFCINDLPERQRPKKPINRIVNLRFVEKP